MPLGVPLDRANRGFGALLAGANSDGIWRLKKACGPEDRNEQQTPPAPATCGYGANIVFHIILTHWNLK